MPRVHATTAIALLLLIGCNAQESHDVAAPPPPSRPIAFESEGTPGPWWRDGASRVDYDQDSDACLDRSAAQRRAAGAKDGADAAYRAYLDCMVERRWNRGWPGLKHS